MSFKHSEVLPSAHWLVSAIWHYLARAIYQLTSALVCIISLLFEGSEITQTSALDINGYTDIALYNGRYIFFI